MAWRVVSEDSPQWAVEPFLLIVRTSQIVTAAEYGEYWRIQSEFPAYSQVFLRNYNGDLIVTAAVYRGFDQELRRS